MPDDWSAILDWLDARLGRDVAERVVASSLVCRVCGAAARTPWAQPVRRHVYCGRACYDHV